MYEIDKAGNKISKLNEKTFSELGFKEKEHLQEWLAGNPEALGEDLLIIQKEFAGFQDTNERLDLLALDKHGNLVVIENKLDDSGRDVTWQVLKYASYCSSLTKEDVRHIYQEYLLKIGEATSAEDKLSEFFESLHERGLSKPELLISDAHEGLVKALTKTFPGTEWQRCQVHFRKNVMDKVRVRDKASVKEQLNHVFAAPDKAEGLKRLHEMVEELSESYPSVADMLEKNGEDTLSCLNYPVSHRKRISSTNGLERYNEEIRRRTRVIRIFPNRNACMRLIGALCMEQAEEWLTGRKYLNMEISDRETETEVKQEKSETVDA